MKTPPPATTTETPTSPAPVRPTDARQLFADGSGLFQMLNVPIVHHFRTFINTPPPPPGFCQISLMSFKYQTVSFYHHTFLYFGDDSVSILLLAGHLLPNPALSAHTKKHCNNIIKKYMFRLLHCYYLYYCYSSKHAVCRYTNKHCNTIIKKKSICLERKSGMVSRASDNLDANCPHSQKQPPNHHQRKGQYL